MEALAQDARIAVRQLLKRPGTTALILVILAIGIGVNTSVFTLVNAALFRPVFADRPDELVRLFTTTREQTGRNLSYPEYREFRDRVGAFEGLVASEQVTVTVGGQTPERTRAIMASGNFFDVLGVRAIRGRTFVPDEDDVPGAAPVVVLSHSFWQRRYGGNPAAVGATLIINGHTFTIVGIVPRGFEGVELMRSPQLWVPLATLPQAWPARRDQLTAHRTWLHVFARLGPNVSAAQASAEATSVATTLGVPASAPDGLTGARVEAVAGGGLTSDQRAREASGFAMLMAVPLLVLLVACANVANLLLARGLARQKELAVRRAIGATRGRLVRQLLTESVLLSLAGAALGVLVSFWITGALVPMANLPPAVADALSPDRTVLAFTTGLAVLTALVFGLAPALTATQLSLTPALKQEGTGYGGGGRGHRVRDVFVIVELAVSCVLVITTGLFLRSLANALDVHPGFETRNGVAVSFDLTMQGYTDEQRRMFYTRVLERARAIPGVLAASVGGVPLHGERAGGDFESDEGTEYRYGMMSGVWPRYFRTMGIPLRRGREFSDADNRSGAPVIIVNEELARTLWGDQDPIGKRVRLKGPNQPLREVIGVAADGKYVRLTEFGGNPRKHAYEFAFLPEPQMTDAASAGMSLVVRSAGDPATVIPALRQMIRDIDQNPPLHRVATFEEIVAGGAPQLRQLVTLVAVFGSVALVLAALGLYGVIAHAVTGRTREIGVRMSLGAQRTMVLSLFLGEGLRLAAIGVVIGAAASAAVATVLSTQGAINLSGFLYGLTPVDPLTFVSSAAVLALVALAASYLPARRAAGVDPMVALRYE